MIPCVTENLHTHSLPIGSLPLQLSVPGRCHAHESAEHPVKVADIVKACHAGDLPDIMLPHVQQFDADTDPVIIQIFHDRFLGHFLKQPAKMSLADMKTLRQQRDRNVFLIMLLKVGNNLLCHKRPAVPRPACIPLCQDSMCVEKIPHLI